MLSKLKLIEARLKIYGRVQGVGFRYYCQRQANGLGLVGRARNLADGTVEIIIQGEESLLKKFYRQCRKGPPLAQVEKLEIGQKQIERVSYQRFMVE